MRDGRRVILGQDHAQAVGQRQDLILQLWRLYGGTERDDENGHRQGEETNPDPLHLPDYPRSTTEQPEASGHPGCGAKLQWIGINPPFDTGKQFDRPAAAFEPEPAFGPVACLATPAGAPVHAEVADAARSQHADPGPQQTVRAKVGIELPRVIDERLLDRPAQVGAGVKVGAVDQKGPTDAAADHVPVNRLVLVTVAKMSGLVMKDGCRLELTEPGRQRTL